MTANDRHSGSGSRPRVWGFLVLAVPSYILGMYLALFACNAENAETTDFGCDSPSSDWSPRLLVVVAAATLVLVFVPWQSIWLRGYLVLLATLLLHLLLINPGLDLVVLGVLLAVTVGVVRAVARFLAVR
jgi:hypothetical protein